MQMNKNVIGEHLSGFWLHGIILWSNFNLAVKPYGPGCQRLKKAARKKIINRA